MESQLSWTDLWYADKLERTLVLNARRDGRPIELLAHSIQAEPGFDREAAARAVRAARAAEQRIRLGPFRAIDVVREYPDAPTSSACLLLAGSAPLLAPGALAIVGTRRLDRTATRLCEELIDEICSRLPVRIVSGGALGVDAIAQAAALRHQREMVVVLAGGLGHASPATHRDQYRAIVDSGGLIVSERPPQCSPQRYEFVRRNRLIAWIADATLVVRAPVSSGALATAAWARHIARPVLAVPGLPSDPLSAGCHDLLRSGARLCTGAADVAATLGMSRQQLLPGLLPAVPMSDRATSASCEKLLDALAGRSLTPDQLADTLGYPLSSVLVDLLEAELGGVAQQDSHGRWTLTPSR